MSALAADTDLGALVLDLVARHLVVKSKIDVESRIVDGRYERTIGGASTLTIMLDDGDRELLRSGIFGVQQLGLNPIPSLTQLDVEVDDLWYRLVQVQKQQNTLTLTFEDRIVALLRTNTKPRKASRAVMTRAEFALSLVREIKEGGPYPFICPELTKTQPIAPIKNSGQAVSTSQRKSGVQHGISPNAQLTVKGRKATREQLTNGQKVLDVANSLSAGQTATLALIEACIVESSMRNLSYGDSTSTGILQVLASTAQGIGIDPRDVSACANTFLTRGFYHGGAIANAAKHPTWTAGEVAQAAQGSAYPKRYDQVQREAEEWIGAYTGPTPGSALKALTPQQLRAAPYYFQRGGTTGKREDSWTCMQRLASEVNWRCFCADGAIYFVDDEDLLAQKPSAWVYEGTKGVENVDFQIDLGKVKSDVTLTARTRLHDFAPGDCVELYDCGPADGRWLVSDHVRGIFDPLATITLTRAIRPLAEPAPSTMSVAAAAGPGGQPAPSGVDAHVSKAYAQAQLINSQRYVYVWGGGHKRCGTPDTGIKGGPGGGVGIVGYDCSGSTCAVLAAGGMGFRKGGPVDDSGQLESWGAAGPGKTMTVYASRDHVWIEFKTSNGTQDFTTSNYGKGFTGPGFEKAGVVNKSGYVARHWPGT